MVNLLKKFILRIKIYLNYDKKKLLINFINKLFLKIKLYLGYYQKKDTFMNLSSKVNRSFWSDDI